MPKLFSVQPEAVYLVDEQKKEFLKTELPPRFYSVEFSPMTGHYLTYADGAISLPKKLYGNVTERAEKILDAYERIGNTGVILTGIKGAGKTLLSSKVCFDFISRFSLPVLFINKPEGEINDMVEFIKSVGPCCLFFDEFGKKFISSNNSLVGDKQSPLLTLFDGSDGVNRLLVCTENRVGLINEFFLSRPGRIRYHFKYNKIEHAVIDEVCSDRKVSEITQFVKTYSDTVLEISFDVLNAIILEYEMFHLGKITDYSEFSSMIENLNVDKPFTYGEEILLLKGIYEINEDGTLGDRLKFSQKSGQKIKYIQGINFCIDIKHNSLPDMTTDENGREVSNYDQLDIFDTNMCKATQDEFTFVLDIDSEVYTDNEEIYSDLGEVAVVFTRTQNNRRGLM